MTTPTTSDTDWRTHNDRDTHQDRLATELGNDHGDW